jgi:hypothetical protein
MSELDIICPVKPEDHDRLAILHRSMCKFLRMDWRLFIIYPRYSPKLPKRILADGGRCLALYDDAVLADMPADPAEWKWPGWWVQQAIKIAMAPWISSPVCLTLDADCLVVKPVGMADLVDFHGRAKTNYGVHGSWDNWYAGSAALLGTPVPTRKIQVTPFLFATPLLKLLYDKLKSLHPEAPWTWLLEHSRVPGSDDCWTEYCLYHCWGEQVEMGKAWERYHVASARWMYGNSAWTPEQANAWEPAKSFEAPHNDNFLFSVIQSVCEKPAEWVWERVQQYLEE